MQERFRLTKHVLLSQTIYFGTSILALTAVPITRAQNIAAMFLKYFIYVGNKDSLLS